jgi:hypothetical protein
LRNLKNVEKAAISCVFEVYRSEEGSSKERRTAVAYRRFYINPEQEIELVLDNPRSAHILRMPGISKASAVVVHQIFHTHAKG